MQTENLLQTIDSSDVDLDYQILWMILFAIIGGFILKFYALCITSSFIEAH